MKKRAWYTIPSERGRTKKHNNKLHMHTYLLYIFWKLKFQFLGILFFCPDPPGFRKHNLPKQISQYRLAFQENADSKNVTGLL
jgi:hypothetical protein